MALVAMGEHDPLDALGMLPQVGEVGEDEVDAGHVGGGEHEPAVDEEECGPRPRCRRSSARSHRDPPGTQLGQAVLLPSPGDASPRSRDPGRPRRSRLRHPLWDKGERRVRTPGCTHDFRFVNRCGEIPGPFGFLSAAGRHTPPERRIRPIWPPSGGLPLAPRPAFENPGMASVRTPEGKENPTMLKPSRRHIAPPTRRVAVAVVVALMALGGVASRPRPDRSNRGRSPRWRGQRSTPGNTGSRATADRPPRRSCTTPVPSPSTGPGTSTWPTPSTSASAGSTPAGTITTVAGSGVEGFAGDAGLRSRRLVNQPHGVAVDAAGNVYIADSANHRIRQGRRQRRHHHRGRQRHPGRDRRRRPGRAPPW